MRRPLATAVPAALMAVLLVVGTTLAGHGHATGGGEFDFGVTQRLEFEAHDYGPASPRDRGTAHYQNLDSGIEYQAEIVCAFVTTNVVRFGYVIPQDEPGIGGLQIIWEITDGGSPGAGNDSAYFVVAPAESCDQDTVPFAGSNVLNGNFTVHEAN